MGIVIHEKEPLWLIIGSGVALCLPLYLLIGGAGFSIQVDNEKVLVKRWYGLRKKRLTFQEVDQVIEKHGIDVSWRIYIGKRKILTITEEMRDRHLFIEAAKKYGVPVIARAGDYEMEAEALHQAREYISLDHMRSVRSDMFERKDISEKEMQTLVDERRQAITYYFGEEEYEKMKNFSMEQQEKYMDMLVEAGRQKNPFARKIK